MTKKTSKRRSSLRRNALSGVRQRENKIVVQRGYSYPVRVTAHFRKRKPPKMVPTWMSNLQPWETKKVLKMVSAEGVAKIPELLDQFLSLAEKWAASEGCHLLMVDVDFTGSDTDRDAPPIARWNNWYGWSAAKVTITD
jgi:hypothetical protein